MSQSIFTGIPWYSEDDYPNIINMMHDSHTMPPLYFLWEEMVQQLVMDCFEKGIIVYRAMIRSRTFPAWCAERELVPDANARIIFANEYAYARAINGVHGKTRVLH